MFVFRGFFSEKKVCFSLNLKKDYLAVCCSFWRVWWEPPWAAGSSWGFRDFLSVSLVSFFVFGCFVKFVECKVICCFCPLVLLLHCSLAYVSFSSPLKPHGDFKSNVQDAQSLVGKMLKNIPAVHKSCVRKVKKILLILGPKECWIISAC